MRTATEEHFKVSKSIGYEMVKKQLKKRSKKSGF